MYERGERKRKLRAAPATGKGKWQGRRSGGRSEEFTGNKIVWEGSCVRRGMAERKSLGGGGKNVVTGESPSREGAQSRRKRRSQEEKGRSEGEGVMPGANIRTGSPRGREKTGEVELGRGGNMETGSEVQKKAGLTTS